MENIFKNIPVKLKDELFESIISNDNFKLERIVSDGHITENDFWYDQEQDEWVILLSGQAVIEYENLEKIDLLPGDYIIIPAHKTHRVVYTSQKEKTVWLALHF